MRKFFLQKELGYPNIVGQRMWIQGCVARSKNFHNRRSSDITTYVYGKYLIAPFFSMQHLCMSLYGAWATVFASMCEALWITRFIAELSGVCFKRKRSDPKCIDLI